MRQPLPVIPIGSPCIKPWEQMRGDARVRFCDHCNLHVHNLSEMDSDEARRVLKNRTGRTCVCYTPTIDGKIRTLDYQPAPGPFRRTHLWIGAATIVAILSWIIRLSTWAKPAPPVPLLGKVMGDIAAPPARPAQVQGTIPPR